MYINFKVGDVVAVNQTYVDTVIAAKTQNERRKRQITALRGLTQNNTLVSGKGFSRDAGLPYLVVTPLDSRRNHTFTICFDSYEELNNSFTMVAAFAGGNAYSKCFNNTSKVIARGDFVIKTDLTLSGPQIPEVRTALPTELDNSAICGIAIHDIMAGFQGTILTEGIFTGFNTSSYFLNQDCFVKHEGGVTYTVPGAYYREVGIVLGVGTNGTIYFYPQPGGVYDRFEARQLEGIGNNRDSVNSGKAGSNLKRLTGVGYVNGFSLPPRDLPSPREITNAVFSQGGSILNEKNATDFLWLWGQFIDHDIGLTDTDSGDPMDIPVPIGDPEFDPGSTGTQVIEFNRSVYTGGSGVTDPRQQINSISSFIDATNVYGEASTRSLALRVRDGTGWLHTSAGNLLPFNIGGLPNAPTSSDPTLFLAGDVRANEHLALTAMHTLFMREHNRLCDLIRSNNPHLVDEQVYQSARRFVIGLMQKITYKDFLPILLGPTAIPAYTGYKQATNPQIANEFSTACYRLGHSLVSSTLLRLDASNNPIPQGNISLKDAFFSPSKIATEGGIDPLLRGAAYQVCQKIDTKVVDELRNFLFGAPGSGGLDLGALNIQRGRDHGLPHYNQVRVDLGLSPCNSFSDITSDSSVRSALMSVYTHTNHIDLWVGALAEDHVANAMVGELMYTVLKRQFIELRDGDRFWYERIFSGNILNEIETTTLADIIRRNTAISNEIQDNVFIKS